MIVQAFIEQKRDQKECPSEANLVVDPVLHELTEEIVEGLPQGAVPLVGEALVEEGHGLRDLVHLAGVEARVLGHDLVGQAGHAGVAQHQGKSVHASCGVGIEYGEGQIRQIGWFLFKMIVDNLEVAPIS